ncbi:hypothetical protein GE21DRAFT_9165 [Neurospora crassa]|uniref:Plus3 domain-containing protein n=2 Tax=Neurospora crassa TaxID=5141 RepID=Q7RZB2_NEUCR|nr:hypothetical protein NCU03956 [Neurospora crassa OR74A]EAA28359.1 hypothetical protein NCU03956 [Neurospora crassa OR74A]KHE86306.1 hypothetical protein GE21DRAFT_9165 [Neurospora crassa]CAF06149.1 related to Pol II transcription elongation factor [Neurospora crassa]|eukprot:XP_957595.1 hypothetical protein NCU03956 [Neurospora crassa OR74A]
MSDIDDELLALAGGDASDDSGDEAMDMSRDDSRSPSPEPRKKDTSTRGTAKKSVGRKRARSDDESEDEGQASPPGSPDSQASAPMDESDSDSDASPARRSVDDEVNQYPVDGLFRDYEEKEQIMGMREIEREQILAERREENERIRQNRMLRQLKVNQEKKRKASLAELDDSSRKTSRARTKADDKMDSLRRAREERSNRKEQRERENDRRKRSPSYRRSPGRGDDSDVDWDGPSNKKHRSRSPESRESPPAELRDFERVRVGRSRFAEVAFYPGFDEALTGCFVRLNIGPDPDTRQDVYRMALIKGFTTGKAYALEDHQGHQMVVDMYVKAAHGKAVREWPLITCSDRKFTEAEYNRYKQVCLAEGVPFPDKQTLVDKIDDINRLVQRTWTEQELSDKLKRQNALQAKFSGAQREYLKKQLDIARQANDEAAIARYQERLEKLEVPRLAFRTSLTKKDGKKELTQQEKLALKNMENRRRNAEEVRKAQLRERAKARQIERKIERGEAVQEDMSRRLITRPKFVHDSSEKATPSPSKAGTPAPDTPSKSESKNSNGVLPHIAKLQEQHRLQQKKNGLPVISAPLMDDEIIGAMDLGIDIEL